MLPQQELNKVNAISPPKKSLPLLPPPPPPPLSHDKFVSGQDPDEVDLVVNGINNSNQMPYRKQSVFVAPVGLSWIISESKNSQTNYANTHTSSKTTTLTTPLSSYSQVPFANIKNENNPPISNRYNTTDAPNFLPPSLLTTPSTTTISNSSSPTSLPLKANVQEIEKHISKIILENAAIVETSDPKWTKKYLSRHSVSSVPSGLQYSSVISSDSLSEACKNTPMNNHHHHHHHHNLNKPAAFRRYSEIVDPHRNSGSKLQSALLGKIGTSSSIINNNNSNSCSVYCQKVVSAGNFNAVPVLASNQHNFRSINSKEEISCRKYSEPYYPSVIKSLKGDSELNDSFSSFLSAKKSTDSPSLVRNLLTSSKSSTPATTSPSSFKVKSVPVIQKLSTTSIPTADLQINSPNLLDGSSSPIHPENPEGSIIKDLLLKARDDGDRKLSRSSVISPVSQEELTMLVYVCTICKIAFRNKETLEAHQLHYCKASDSHNTNLVSSNQLQLLNDHVQRKMSVMESNVLQHQLTRPFSHPIQYHHKQVNINGGNVQKIISGTSSSSSSYQTPQVGNILKQQLLSPFQSPPFKKRKSSEPVFMKTNHHHLSSSSSHQRNTLLFDNGNSIELTNFSAQKASFATTNSSRMSSTGKLNDLDLKLPVNTSTNLTSGDITSSHKQSKSSPQTLLNNNENVPFESHLDFLPDYNQHLKSKQTKITIVGPVMFPVLRKILGENNENIEFQVQQINDLESININVNDFNSARSNKLSPNYCLYKHVPSMPEVETIVCKSEQEKKGDYFQTDDCDEKKTDADTIAKSVNIGTSNEIESLDNSVHCKTGDSWIVNITDASRDMKNGDSSSVSDNSETSLNIVIPNQRPKSLAIKKQPYDFNKLIGSTLVSPDTPRPWRKCTLLNINGSSYTHMGSKLKTRPTFCCIYRPQPMYVPQETKSKLSMYSNWQIIAPHDSIFTQITPGQLFNAYESRQWKLNPIIISIAPPPTAFSKKPDNYILTPSSYWSNKKSIRSQSTCPQTTSATSLSKPNNEIGNKRKVIDVSENPFFCIVLLFFLYHSLVHTINGEVKK